MPKFIFVTGATGSGKSTVSTEMELLIKERGLSVATLSLDHYYLPKSRLDPDKPKNFDVPEALEQELIIEHLIALEAGKTIARPTYDMETSDRIPGGEVEFPPQDVIIVEGIFAGEYSRYLNRDTEQLKVYLHSPQLNDNYTRKEERDSVIRKKSPEHIKAMKSNQMLCLFKYVAPHMTTSHIVIHNEWQPAASSSDSRSKVPMIIEDKLERLMSFLSSAVSSSLVY
ncbi:uridine kinase [Legionella quateirensis]|uniref:Uridine kinase n=1 Tax=Legionella quateirensis TaxID=45072 RepID=A0ABR5RHY1_9GAMM|nr:uridine kinase [Legionella quateirensis]KTD43364.1 uridine kinase [Legionella quateirensis]